MLLAGRERGCQRWEREFAEGEEARRQKWVVGRPEISLSDVEWVVVDEADVLFGAYALTHTISPKRF